MSLKIYKKKRNFKKTPEPKGEKKTSQSKRLYVIQKHAASHLHYDFRLELDGVLKSWAVPKGPSLDPNVKRLAVHVEDHPISYGSFEGTIPKGQYGGGAVMLWDEGEWQIKDANADKAYKSGNMTFELKGKKLKGLWKLVQIKKDPKNWLLIKIKDKYARPSEDYDITEKKPLSIVSKKSIEQLSGLNPKKKVSSKASRMPTFISPQLATLTDKPPYGDKWLHEIKFDGYRLICFIKNGNIKLITRGHQDWTDKFPAIVKKLKTLKLPNVIMDGEVVVLDEKQHSNFQLLQNTINNKIKSPMIYYLFDLIYHDNHDISSLPLLERKKLLHSLIKSTKDGNVRYSDHVIGNGNAAYQKACRLSLEGIISKLINSTYHQKRTKDWLKVKCIHRQEFIVIGYTKPRGERKFFGSLLLAIYSDNKLKYCGHVGTGSTDDSLKSMAQLLKKYETSSIPISTRPSGIKNVTWVKPKIIVEVEFSEWTNEGILRHPSFKGLRKDKSPTEVTMETPTPPANKDFPYHLTSPDKILYPEGHITKIELAKFYDNIQKWVLPYVINRPLTLVRCPQGIKSKCFFQKHLAEAKVKHIYGITIKEKNKKGKYIYIKDIDGLIALVQLGVLEIHPWNCQIDQIEKPDMIIFDLDPAPDVPWKKVIDAAHYLKEQLAKIHLTSFVKTTGGKGLHIVVPIKRGPSWSDIKEFSHAFVETITLLKPRLFIDKMTKSKRTHKIYIDYLRNQRGATAVAAYSTRARENAPVSTPLAWNELSTRIKSNTFTLNNLPKRLLQLKKDPWKDFYDTKQSINLKNIK